MLLQVDASRHDWLEGRGSHLTLVGAKDDATREVWAQFCEAETCWTYLGLIRAISLSAGVPLALYSDRHTIFHQCANHFGPPFPLLPSPRQHGAACQQEGYQHIIEGR
jgi:hypothetical protein